MCQPGVRHDSKMKCILLASACPAQLAYTLDPAEPAQQLTECPKLDCRHIHRKGRLGHPSDGQQL